MRRTLNIYSVLTICIFFITQILSQDIKFEHLTVEDGLSGPKVKCIIQDHKGFMWFGTNDGLNKYDGYSYTVYRTDNQDSFSINNTDIRALYEDPSGIIWIATGGGGLNRFDPETEIFTSYRYHTESFVCGYVQKVDGFTYNNGFSLWIGTCMALVKYDLSRDIFLSIPPTEDNIWSWPKDFISAMVIDDSGNVWVGCPEGGMHKYDPFKNQYSHYRHDPQNKNSLSSDHILSLAEDQTGDLWIDTQNGLNYFNPVTKEFTHFYHDPDNINSLSSNEILSLYKDKSGQLWIGTGNGLNKMDNNTGNFTRYFNNPEDPHSIVSNYILSIYEDRSGVIWIGTDQGISKVEPQKQLFSHYGYDPAIPNSLFNKSIMAVYETHSGGKDYLWLGTRYNGIYKIDRETGKIVNYRHDPANPNSLSNNWARPWLKSRYKGQDELWIRTRNGLNRLNLDSGNFTHYFHDPDNSNSVNSNEITEIYEDPSGRMWITSYRGGLQMFNRETGEFKTIAGKSDIGQVFEDHVGNFWIARWGSLAILNRDTYAEKIYWHRSDTLSTISHPSISVIYQDKAKRLWIGAHGGGLNQYHYESDQFSRYTVDDGLPNGTINEILEDNQGNLWLSTNNGLSKFNPNANTFTNYDVSDGLLSNQYNHRSCYKSPDGEMFFGGAKGLDAFYPESLTNNQNIPTVILTDFQLFNKPVALRKKGRSDGADVYTLPKHISALEEIKLSYKENIFSFEFAVLDYRSPEKNQYAYMLDGLEKDWNYTNHKRRFATYTNLDPGEYIFKVKGSNNDGIWNEVGTSIRIIIIPPWWRTNLAYLFYLLLFIGGIVTTWHFQVRRIHLRNELKMKKFEANKLQEVDHLKSRFFANISHEFRTPLTLIKGPVKQMLEEKFVGNLKETYKMMLRNSDRLLSLINQILDLSKLESGEIKLKVAETDIIKYLKEIILSFSSLAESKKVILKFSCIENSIIGYVDLDKLEKIVSNLLSNAFKFTPEGGEVIVNIGHPPQSPLEGGLKGGCSDQHLQYRSRYPT